MNAEATAVTLGSSLRLVVASSCDLTRRRVLAALERPEFAVVAECSDGASATAAVVRHRADMCLVDVDLPAAAETVAAVASLPLAPKVVVLGSGVDERAFLAALDNGAAGYLLTDSDPGRLADELTGVAEGGLALAPALAAHLVESFRLRPGRGSPRPAELTDREWQVLELLADGLTTKEIALRLRVSSTAVRRYVSSAVRRVGSSGPLLPAP